MRESLRRILSPAPPPADAEEFVALALRIATLYIQRKIRSGAINPAFFGLSASDLAVDCVGPLFERNPEGRFVQLHTYYDSIDWEMLDEIELFGYTRRLIFSKVHQELARLHRESDPSLEKLMRNLRNAMRAVGHLVEERHGQDLWIAVQGGREGHRSLPLMPWEFLEGSLTPHIHSRTSLKDIVCRVAQILREQKVYRQSLPFTTVALTVRKAFVHVGLAENNVSDEDEAALTAGEIRQAVGVAVASVTASKHDTYVLKGKITPRTYAAYMAAVCAILEAEFVENDGHDKSYHQRLAEQMGGLTATDYHQLHRCHCEYLVKLTRQEFLRVVKKELCPPNPGSFRI